VVFFKELFIEKIFVAERAYFSKLMLVQAQYPVKQHD